MMKTGTRWAIPVVSYNHIYQTWSINGCLRYSISDTHKLCKALKVWSIK